MCWRFHSESVLSNTEIYESSKLEAIVCGVAHFNDAVDIPKEAS